MIKTVPKKETWTNIKVVCQIFKDRLQKELKKSRKESVEEMKEDFI